MIRLAVLAVLLLSPHISLVELVVSSFIDKVISSSDLGNVMSQYISGTYAVVSSFIDESISRQYNFFSADEDGYDITDYPPSEF